MPGGASNHTFHTLSESITMQGKDLYYTVNILVSSTLLKRSSTLLKTMDPASNLVLTQDAGSSVGLLFIGADVVYPGSFFY